MSRSKRQRQKENTRAAREAREAAQKRQRRKTAATRIIVGVAVVGLAVGLAAVLTGGDDDPAATDTSSTTVAPALPEGCVDTVPPENPNRPTFTEPPAMEIDPAKTYTATISTSCGDLVLALDAVNAPTSVNNFVVLARAGFFDGLKWNRASRGFVIQTGSPNNTQEGGPGYSVQAELPPAGTYLTGSVAWAKGGSDPAGTAGSQFFVVTGDGTGLTPDYGHLGLLTDGIENALKMETLAPETGDGPPVVDIYINTVTIAES